MITSEEPRCACTPLRRWHGYKVAQQPLALYHLKEDIGELTDVSAAHPDIVERLKKLAEPFRQKLGDSLTKTVGTEVRPLGRAE